MNDEHRQAFEQKVLAAVPRAVACACLLVITTTLGFAAIDLLAYPARIELLWSMRAVTIACCLVLGIWVVARQVKTYAAGVCILVIGVTEVLAVTFASGDAESRYVTVVPLCFMVAASFLPLTWRHIVIPSIAIVVAYMVTFPQVFASTPWTTYTLNVAEMLLGAAAATVSVVLRRAQQRREFVLSTALAQQLTQFQVTNDDLSRATTELKSLDRAKSDFFANVNHELRTPLAIVMAHLQALDEKLGSLGAAGGTAHGHVVKARQSAVRLLGLVTDILDLTRLDMHKLRLRLENVNLLEFLGPLVQDIAELAANKGVAVVFELPVIADAALGAGAAYAIQGDRNQLERVVINLLTNGIKFTPAGGKVTVSLQQIDGLVTLCVADTGQGISPEALPHLFERGYQSRSAPLGGQGASAFSDGLGIGLNLVKLVVEAHQGSIAVTSKLGTGTEFRVSFQRTVQLPTSAIERRSFAMLAQEERRGVEDAIVVDRTLERQMRLAEVTRLTRGEQPHHGAARKRGVATVLIVDDSSELVDILAEILSAYDVLAASDGAEGLAQAIRYRPDIILSDVMMPNGGGLELLKNVRAHPDLTGIPVVMVTASGAMQVQIEAGEIGADGYIAKPFDGRLVRATVARLLAREKGHVDDILRAQGDSLAILARGLAHNVLNALQYISGSLMLLSQQVEELSAQFNPEDQARVRREGASNYDSGLQGIGRVQDGIRALQRVVDKSAAQDAEVQHINEIVRRAIITVGGVEAMPTRLNAASSVRVRPGELEDVIINLIKNAQEAAQDRWKIEVESEDDADRGGVVVRVIDHGPGMDATTLRRAFDPDFSTKARGSGVGLALSRQVVRALGGHIDVESELGKGAKFSVWLPTTPSSDEQV